MNIRSTVKRAAACMLVFVMAAAFVPVFGLDNAQAASKTGRLVKSVTRQYKSDGKYVTFQKLTFKYNKKGDPVKIVVYNYSDGKLTSTETIKNTYKYTKKGVRKSRKVKWSDRTDAAFKCTYNKKGLPAKLVEDYPDDYTDWDVINTFKYSKKGFLKSWGKVNASWVEKEKYTVKQKKGLLKKTTKYEYDYDLKQWIESNVSKYNKKGLITKLYYSGQDANITFKYKMKKGRVSSVIKTDDQGDDYVNVEYFKIKYNKKKISNARYAKMINYLLTDEYTVTVRNAFMYAWY